MNAHINLYGFWNETAFLTKSGDLGMVLRVPGVDAPVGVIQQAAEECELTVLVEHFDPRAVGKLPDECLHSLLQPRKIMLDLRVQQGRRAQRRDPPCHLRHLRFAY